MKKFKKGAASFYIVAFSTLILVIIATSFATVIASELTRTANDDLSQSAYDSALAGVEDAKLAFASYRRCVEAGKTDPTLMEPSGGGSITCAEIMWWMQHPDCSMVGHILGKIPKGEQGEVTVGGEIVTTGSKETTTNQAYTCVMINTDLNDYRATLNYRTKVRTLKASVGDAPTNDVKKIKLEWYSVRPDVTLVGTNFDSTSGVVFPRTASNSIAVPPTVELQIVQTAASFHLSDFDEVGANRTDRATLYLVPAIPEKGKPSFGEQDTYIGVLNGQNENVISADQVVKTNDRSVKNKPFAVYCNETGDFYCSVDIELPDPIGGGNRNNHTFIISLSLPYQQPDTDFSIALYCSDGGNCGNIVKDEEGNDLKDESGNRLIKISNTQVSIDSTGRANDLYRRVETRLETADTTFGAGYPYYALEILGPDGISKIMSVKKEDPFYF